MTATVRAVAGAQDLEALRRVDAGSGTQPTVDRVLVQPEDASGEDALRRLVAEEDGGVVGYAYFGRSAWYPAGDADVEVFVTRDARGRGVGSALAAAVVEEAEREGLTRLTAFAHRLPEYVAFAERRGFTLFQRFVTMTLDVRNANDELLDEHLRGAREQGFRLFRFSDTPQGIEEQHKLHELNRRLAPSLPGNGDEFPSFEEYQREIVQADWFRPDGQLIAADGDRWVALVGLGYYEDGRRLGNEFTAVDAAYRGRGIAKALKAWSVVLARESGAEEIQTGNDATNEAIIAVNSALGYTSEPGIVKLRRSIGEARHRER